MSSPFSLFRRYEKTMMVVITGVAMVSFVLLGSVQNPQDIPGPLLVLFVAALLGCIAWLAGLGKGKGVEWGLSGALIGAIIGLVGLISSRQASAVLTDSGNFTQNDLADLSRQKSIANSFIRMAFQQSFGMDIPQQMQRQYLMNFFSGDEIDNRDIVMGALLRKEADKMGMVISDKIVMDFAKRVTSKQALLENLTRVSSSIDPQSLMYMRFIFSQAPEKPLTVEAFTKIKNQLRVSESELLDALRNELKAVQAFELLYGRNELPPEAFWEFYRQLNVRQSADVAVIPVSDFVAADAKPSELELQELFSQYRSNTPGFTPEGEVEEGRPGFLQPRRFQLGYFEAVYSKIEPLVGEVTDEEIQQRYDERYKRTVPENGSEVEEPDLTLPRLEMPKLQLPTEDAPPAGELPAENAGEMKKEAPAPESKEEPAAEKKDEPKPEEPKKEEPQPDAPKADAPAGETPKAEEAPKADEAPAPETPQPDAPAEGGESTSGVMSLPETQLVAFFQEEPAAGDAPKEEAPKEDAPKPEAAPEKPADAPKAEEKPAAEEKKPEEKPAEAPAEPKGDAMPAPAGDAVVPPAPGDEVIPAAPKAPASDVPVLDDKLKAEIRQQILRERTLAEIQKRISAAYDHLGDISYRVQMESGEENALTLEQGNKELEKYAAEHQLVYVVTPLLSYQQLRESEDYPIGQAIATTGQRGPVADVLYYSNPTAIYRTGRADNILSSASFAYWKLADKASYVPKSLDDEKDVREQVVEAWKMLKAEPKAKARAEELAKLVRESDKPVAEALGEATITGQEGSLFLTVRSTGDFSWMSKPIVPPTSMQATGSVSPSVIPGVEDPGTEFYSTVFNQMQPGDVRVIPNRDKSAYFIVKILNRNPSNPEELEKFREEFLKSGMQNWYVSLGQQVLSKNSTNWIKEFFDQHEVVFLGDQ